MVQTLASNRANDPLDVRMLLWRSRRFKYFLNAKLLHLLREVITEDAVTITP